MFGTGVETTSEVETTWSQNGFGLGELSNNCAIKSENIVQFYPLSAIPEVYKVFIYEDSPASWTG